MGATHRPVFLIAEDDSDYVFLFREAVSASGIEARLQSVSNGADLVAWLTGRGIFADRRECPMPDLVFLDLRMPRMDGGEALAELASIPGFRLPPVYVTTALILPERREELLALGVQGFVSKPVAAEEIKDLAARHC